MNKKNMKQSLGMKGLLWVAIAVVSLPAIANLKALTDNNPDAMAPQDTIGVAAVQQQAPVEEEINWDSLNRYKAPYTEIKVLPRTYGDSVVLRWAVDKFPEWLHLARYGVNIVRRDESVDGFKFDTIAYAYKALTLEQFKAKYPDESDSLAYMAMGSLYSKGGLKAEQTKYEPGSMGSFVEIEQDQMLRLMAAYLVSEWRQDLAEDLALRFVDRKAKKNATYSYYIVPTVKDTTRTMLFASGRVEHLKNVKFKPSPYNVTLTDTITGHGSVTLRWNDTINGSFEIYRRMKGETEWKNINRTPYLPPFKMEFRTEDAIYENTVGKIGTYEYAVAAHDAFGDLTEMSAPITVTFPDMDPPMGPSITRIIIDRPVDNDPSAKIFADIYFRKDTMERDFVRFVPMYYNERDSLKQWRLLTNQYIAPTDTMVRVDVTHTSTGMITIAAVDTAENMGYAIPSLMRVADLKPPMPPTNLRGHAELDGRVFLHWDMEDTLDIKFYELFFANDTTHHFVRVNHDMIHDKSFTDSISNDANQRYIYYAVRAVDYANNSSNFSDTLRVLRPNPFPPTVAHLDSAYVGSEDVFMRWVAGSDEMISHHVVYRKKESDKGWNIIAAFHGDSVVAKGYCMDVYDKPEVDRQNRYQYAVETFNLWGVSSGLSQIYSAPVRGKNVVDVEIRAFAAYDEKSGESRISWEVEEIPVSVPYFFCIYRKGKENERFVYMTDVDSSERLYTDVRTRPGETAEYYVSIRFRDGRATRKSNVVTVVAPKKVRNEE